MAAYARRSRRELHETGVAMALAQHEPKRLDETFRPPPPEQDGDHMIDKEKKWW
jgi:hypothetical protein